MAKHLTAEITPFDLREAASWAYLFYSAEFARYKEACYAAKAKQTIGILWWKRPLTQAELDAWWEGSSFDMGEMGGRLTREWNGIQHAERLLDVAEKSPQLYDIRLGSDDIKFLLPFLGVIDA